MPHGLDISNWQGELSPERARCVASGQSLIVVRASLERARLVEIARQQIAALKPHVLIHGYIWMYPSWDPVKTVDDALREYGPFDLPWYWIDAEETEDVGGPARNTQWLRAALDRLEAHERKAGIYTGAWWWNDPRHMGGSTEFRETPLWYAEYDNVPDLFHWTPFGGWLNPGGKQYNSTEPLCGIAAVDRNVFADWVVQPAPAPVDYAALYRAELEGYLAAARDDAMRAAVRIEVTARKLALLD